MYRAAIALLLTVAVAVPALARGASGREDRERETNAEAVEAFNEAIEAFNANDFPLAIKKATTALKAELEPEQAGNMNLILGLAHARQKDCTSAVAALDKAIPVIKDPSGALQTRAFCREQAGDSAGALADLEAAEKAKPGDPGVAKATCVIATNGKNWALAVPSCEKAAAAFPTEAEMILASAQAFEQSGDKPKAHAAWSKLLALNPTDQRAKDGAARTK